MKLWLPVSLLIMTIVVATGVALWVKKPVKDTSFPKARLETVQVKLSLQPEMTPAYAGEEASYVVAVKTDNLNVIGVQAYLQYDPQIISVLSVDPATLLPNPDLLLDNIDASTGTIAYALGTKQPSSGNGIAFKIRVKINSVPDKTQTPISFDKQKTKVAVETSDHSKRFSQEETAFVFNEEPLTILAENN